MWRLIAWIVSRKPVADWIIRRAMKRPFKHLDGYMERWWIFNEFGANKVNKIPWLPAIRLHHILRPDLERHLHDHPWNARTIILRGWYIEQRLNEGPPVEIFNDPPYETRVFRRYPGDTARLSFGEYHKIIDVSEGGVWSMFIMRGYQSDWGFLVDGEKIPHKQYEYAKQQETKNAV